MGPEPGNGSSHYTLGVPREEIDSAGAKKRRRLDRLVPTTARDHACTGGLDEDLCLYLRFCQFIQRLRTSPRRITSTIDPMR